MSFGPMSGFGGGGFGGGGFRSDPYGGKGGSWGGKGGWGEMGGGKGKGGGGFLAGVPVGGSGEACKFFQQNGWCKYGEQCKHAHVPGPETPMGVTPPSAMGEVCQFFQKSGWCQYGRNCRYAHTPGPETPMDGGKGSKGGGKSGEVCQFFAKSGWCQYGDMCRYSHIGGGGFGGFGGKGGGGKGGGTPVQISEAPLSPAEYEAAAAALINTPGMKQAEAAGLQLTDEAVQALLKMPAHNASELLTIVAEKSSTLRDPSNFIIATINRGYVPRG